MADPESTIIRRFIVRQMMMEEDESILQFDDPIVESGILDSLGITDMVGFLEKEFGVSISLQQLIPENFATIQSITNLLKECKAESSTWPR